MLTLDLEKIPGELKAHPQWVAWRVEVRDGKPTKVPVNPRSGGNARANDPSTWGTFDQAVSMWEAYTSNGVAGIGYMFSQTDPFTGIDLDHAVVEGSPRLCARLLLRHLGTYVEASPSGQGFHSILKGKLPGPGNKKALPCGMEIEIYDQKRFFTMTGHHLPGTPTTVEDRQAELEALHRQIFGTRGGASPKAPGPSPPSPWTLTTQN